MCWILKRRVRDITLLQWRHQHAANASLAAASVTFSGSCRLHPAAGKGGRYIMGPAKPILPDVPLANAVTLIEAIIEPATMAVSQEDAGRCPVMFTGYHAC